MANFFISDLDDTLLVDGQITPKTRKNLKTILSYPNINFSVASARDIHSIKQVFEGINVKCPIISYGGAFISDLESSTHVYSFSMERTIISEILFFLKNKAIDPFLYLHDKNSGIDTIYYHSISNESMEWCLNSDLYFKAQQFAYYSEINDIIANPIVRIIMKGRSKKILEIYENLVGQFSNKVNIFTYPSWYIDDHHWLIILSKSANKLDAIRFLIHLINEKENDLIYYGDSLNDQIVFSSTIHSIAVDNCSEEIKKLADEVIGSNKKDSVTTHILKNIARQ